MLGRHGASLRRGYPSGAVTASCPRRTRPRPHPCPCPCGRDVHRPSIPPSWVWRHRPGRAGLGADTARHTSTVTPRIAKSGPHGPVARLLSHLWELPHLGVADRLERFLGRLQGRGRGPLLRRGGTRQAPATPTGAVGAPASGDTHAPATSGGSAGLAGDGLQR